MANEERAITDATMRAEQVMWFVEQDRPISPADRGMLVEALTEDLRAEGDRAAVAEERLVKIEAQTRVLADAVIAITHTAEAVDTAIQAVKDEMAVPDGPG